VTVQNAFEVVVVIFTLANLAAGLLLISMAPTAPFFPLITTGQLKGSRQ
jgi:hypothetical protein